MRSILLNLRKDPQRFLGIICDQMTLILLYILVTEAHQVLLK